MGSGRPCVGDLTRDAAGEAGQLPSGTGYQTGRAGKRVCKEKPVLNARLGPDGHTPECAQAQDAASPLSIAIPSHAGECPCTGHCAPARVTLPETPRKSPRGRRCPPRCGLRANLKHPQWKKTRRRTGLTVTHFILFSKNRGSPPRYKQPDHRCQKYSYIQNIYLLRNIINK